MIDSIKTLEERYCPIVGRNVAVEVFHAKPHSGKLCCLNAYECNNQYGGCKNKRLVHK